MRHLPLAALMLAHTHLKMTSTKKKNTVSDQETKHPNVCHLEVTIDQAKAIMSSVKALLV